MHAGQLLATLDLREIDAQLTKAKSGAAKADRDLARATRLYNDSVATRQQLDDAATAAEVAHADVAAASVNRAIPLPQTTIATAVPTSQSARLRMVIHPTATP